MLTISFVVFTLCTYLPVACAGPLFIRPVMRKVLAEGISFALVYVLPNVSVWRSAGRCWPRYECIGVCKADGSSGGRRGGGIRAMPPQKANQGGIISFAPPNNRWAPMAVWGPGPYSIVTRLEKPTPAINSSHTSL